MNRIKLIWWLNHEDCHHQLLSAHAIPVSRQAPHSILGYEGAEVREDPDVIRPKRYRVGTTHVGGINLCIRWPQ